MEVLDAMQGGQYKGKSFLLFGCNELIDVDRVNRLLTFPVATTVAKGLPASGEIGQKDVRHHCHPSRTTVAAYYTYRSGTNAAAIPHRCDPRHDHWMLAAGKDGAHRFRQRPNVVLLVDVNTLAQSDRPGRPRPLSHP
jgi:hypothetical protein